MRDGRYNGVGRIGFPGPPGKAGPQGIVIEFAKSPTSTHNTKCPFKDGAYYCYCTYVLRVSRYSGFLSVMLTNKGIFLHVLNYPEKVDLSKYSWYRKRKFGGTMHFLEIIKRQLEKERHTLLCILKFFTNIVHELSWKNAWLPPIFFMDFNGTC